MPLAPKHTIPSQEAFAACLAQLTQKCRQRGEEWENPTLAQFLEALTAWVEDTGPGWYERHPGEALPVEGNWTYFAHALRAATMYE
ncbi:hypothetical protein ACFRCW_15080 [Streptomyces sp. NPDC056653]|uniref:DUF7660 family protein n=1 Tax=Streptomyces sp. NPDC056653 TaxID=3345894 RepID=UPI0036C4D554